MADEQNTCRACGYLSPIKPGEEQKKCPRCGSEEIGKQKASKEAACAPKKWRFS